jgi:hypothetical protein
MKRANLIQACVAAVCLCLAASANANQLVDGGFEFGGQRVLHFPGTYNGTAEKLGTGDPPLTGAQSPGGWQVIDGAQPTYTFSVGSGDPATQDGSDGYVHIADGGTFGKIRQEFATTIGQEYTLSVWGRLNCCGEPETGIEWELGGVSNGQVTLETFFSNAWTDGGGTVFDWLQFTDNFVANDTVSYINLANITSGMNFDNVSITEFSGVFEGTFQWDVDGPGSWNTGANWTLTAGTPSGNTPNGNDDAIFGSTITNGATVFTDSDVTVRSVQFDNSNSYNVSGLGTVNIDQGANANGAISVVQGTHQFQANVALASNTTVDTSSGATLEFNNRVDLGGNTLTKTGPGTADFNNRVTAGVGGTIDCQDGTCGGTGSISGNLTNSTGTVAPGNSPGILTVDGNYTQGAGGTLALEIGGLVPGDDHDKLVVNGIATLDGTLDVTLINSFTLAGDMLFDVLDFNSVVNDFTTFNLPTGLVWNVSDGTLCFGNCVGGLTDYDNDGTWGLGDLNLVLFNWNEDGANLPPAWLNSRPGAGTLVGLPELNQVLFSWGQPGSLAAVPEPGAVILLGLGSLALLTTNRKNQQMA